jgi:hypothetical protein
VAHAVLAGTELHSHPAFGVLHLAACCAGDVSGSPAKKKRKKPGLEGPQKKYKQMQFTGEHAASACSSW